MSWKKIGWFVVDCIYPYAPSASQEEIQNHATRLSKQAQELLQSDEPKKNLSEECEKLLAEEDSRRQSIDQRLTTVMGLASIAATILFTGILAEASGTLHFKNHVLSWVIAIGSLYLALQICRAILSAIEGLSRRTYDGVEPIDVLQRSDENETFYLRRRAATYIGMLGDHQLQNNAKVDSMAVAHRALKNFIIALLLLATIGSWFAIRTSKDELEDQTLTRVIPFVR